MLLKRSSFGSFLWPTALHLQRGTDFRVLVREGDLHRRFFYDAEACPCRLPPAIPLERSSCAFGAGSFRNQKVQDNRKFLPDDIQKLWRERRHGQPMRQRPSGWIRENSFRGLAFGAHRIETWRLNRPALRKDASRSTTPISAFAFSHSRNFASPIRSSVRVPLTPPHARQATRSRRGH